ncbi:MAG: phosphoglycerate dehydrogenase [Clostridia bacterium]
MSNKVLCTIPKSLFEKYCGRAKSYLEHEGFEVVLYQGEKVMTTEEIKAVGGDICAAILGCDAWTEEVFAACPHLKVLARFGIGVESIDLDAAKRHGVMVCNARGMNSDSVAEMTLMLALAVNRNLINLDRTTREGGWLRNAGHNLHNKTYGLIGFGAIAQNVAKLLKGFDMKRILAFDMMPNQAAADALGVTLTDLETVLRESDVISLHVPGTPTTRHMINEDRLHQMKKDAVLINVARGVVVDESALVKALKEKWIAGAGLDVYETEPTRPDNPLFALENVVLSPHQAADTHETFDAVCYFDAQVVVDVVKNGNRTPINWINR